MLSSSKCANCAEKSLPKSFSPDEHPQCTVALRTPSGPICLIKSVSIPLSKALWVLKCSPVGQQAGQVEGSQQNFWPSSQIRPGRVQPGHPQGETKSAELEGEAWRVDAVMSLLGLLCTCERACSRQGVTFGENGRAFLMDVSRERESPEGVSKPRSALDSADDGG